VYLLRGPTPCSTSGQPQLLRRLLSSTLRDISERANISRPLLYKYFKNKVEIYISVFEHWLVARHPIAIKAVSGPGSSFERLLEVSRVLIVETWNEMAGSAMAMEFHQICARLDPDVSAQHRKVVIQCLAAVLADEQSAEVFAFALDGIVGDMPTTDILDRRVQLLATRFAFPIDAAS